MYDRNLIYRDRTVYAVIGTQPAISAKEADQAALLRMCAVLVDAEDTKTLLCAKGYGKPSQTLAEMVRELPTKPTV